MLKGGETFLDEHEVYVILSEGTREVVEEYVGWVDDGDGAALLAGVWEGILACCISRVFSMRKFFKE